WPLVPEQVGPRRRADPGYQRNAPGGAGHGSDVQGLCLLRRSPVALLRSLLPAWLQRLLLQCLARRRQLALGCPAFPLLQQRLRQLAVEPRGQAVSDPWPALLLESSRQPLVARPCSQPGPVPLPSQRALQQQQYLRLLRQRVRPLGSRLRSEEHTSELQSRENLVCRLLLEKKNCT